MLKQYKEETLLRTCHCDFMGQWRPSAILETMQEVAGTHSEMLGVGRNALIEQGLVWVLTRVEVVMNRYPKVTDTVSVETFPMPVRRWFFPRYYIFRDEQGQELGRAGSLWALLNLSTRHMAPPDTILNLMPDNSDLIAPLGLPGPVTEISGAVTTAIRIPEYTDLDVNHHVNNTKYMDWCCNALGIDCMKDHALRHFCLNYDVEVLPGQEIRTELRTLGNSFSYCGVHGDQRSFDIGGELMERE